MNFTIMVAQTNGHYAVSLDGTVSPVVGQKHHEGRDPGRHVVEDAVLNALRRH